LARAMAKALVQYFEENPPEGTLFANRGKTQQHQVQRGESLSVIAQKYGASVQAIMQANQLKNSRLAVGQRLTIPGGERGPVPVPIVNNPIETETITHTVKSGEFLGKISATYKVSVDAIRRENRLKSDTLFVGQKLSITVSLKDKPLRQHKVQRGEFLGKIANKYNVSVQSIREANQLRSDQLVVGELLIIPNK
ncbi:LysM peptidoglycan-binding domain-containing protein, partial [Vibrio sp. V26_P1S5P106]|uniref:LysM peptidoglycan-binding domain-containing protein n=2 Tax=Vibrio TaxID=662 RepID=UPI00137371AE